MLNFLGVMILCLFEELLLRMSWFLVLGIRCQEYLWFLNAFARRKCIYMCIYIYIYTHTQYMYISSTAGKIIYHLSHQGCNCGFTSVHWEFNITQIYHEFNNAFQVVSQYPSQQLLFSSEKIVHIYTRCTLHIS